MSDNANHKANISFDEFIIEAGRPSAQVLLAFWRPWLKRKFDSFSSLW